MKVARVQLLILLLALFTACNNDVAQVIDNNTVRLTKKIWAFVSITGFDEFSNSLASTLFMGMTYEFKTNGSYEAVILGQPQGGSWEFNNSLTIITLNPGTTDAIEWTLVTLTDDELIITQEDSKAINGKVTWTFR